MTNEQQQVKDMMAAFNQECPETPTIPDLETRKLRAKLILEEALETIKGLGCIVYLHPSDKSGWIIGEDLGGQPYTIEDGPEPSLKDILDGCEDLKVVTEGTLLACGLCPPNPKQIAVGLITPELPATISYEIDKKEDPHFNEVMRSNMSKMWTDAEVEARIGTSDSFDPSGIIATNVYEDEEGNTYRYAIDETKNKERPYIVKDKDGKFIKSPSYSPPNFKLD